MASRQDPPAPAAHEGATSAERTHKALKAPDAQEWAEVFDADVEEVKDVQSRGLGQVCQITEEVWQNPDDPERFQVQGKDKSWFLQKGGLMFDCPDPARFQLQVSLLGDDVNRYGDVYAELSRAEQAMQENWLLMAGVAPRTYKLTGFKDCKAGGFYFLFHLSYRRTCWRIIGCPHNSELEDPRSGKTYSCNPQESDHFEIPAFEGQTLVVEYEDRELWLVDNGIRVLRGYWSHDGGGAEEGKLPDQEYRPVVLTSNCPTRLQVRVGNPTT